LTQYPEILGGGSVELEEQDLTTLFD
jgi:hypothetical protein